MKQATCPICLRDDAIAGRLHDLDARYECQSCGTYDIDHLSRTFLKDLKDRQLLPYLSSAIRRAASRPFVSTDNWEEMAKSQLAIPVSQKLRELLELVARRATTPGEWVALDWKTDLPELAVRDQNELLFLLHHVWSEGHLEFPIDGKNPNFKGLTRLTVKGFETVSPLSAGVSGTCFVAMSFDKSLDNAFDVGLLPAVETDCGFKVIRIDRVHHNDVITDRIISAIRSAQFVVADFTLQKAGVYYEAGFALGLGRPVVWTCREDDKEKLHFDTRQYNHILWSTPEELRSKLTDRIRATIRGARLGN